jgi:hypothetical protein
MKSRLWTAALSMGYIQLLPGGDEEGCSASGSHENGVGCAWWLRAEAEKERGREWGPNSVHHAEGTTREGGGSGW